MNFELSEEQLQIKYSVREFSESEIKPHVMEWDESQHFPEELRPKLAELGLMGVLFPEQYGGAGMGYVEYATIIEELSRVDGSVGISVAAHNSLCGNHIYKYGTEEQKDHYLPRLAKGVEIPCFALTGPEAGSDAGAIPDTGIVCHGQHNGEEHVLGIRLTWEKRYITLGPIATLLGLAFKLHDPDGLLGGEEDLGITLALIPTNTPGVNIGRRHFPLDAAFQNGPNSGKDVFIPLDWVIGGRDGVGYGWRMLVNCLAVGRSIS